MPAYYHELIGQAADLQDAAGGWGGDFDDGTLDSVKPSSAALDPAEVELFALKSSWDVVKACDRQVDQLPPYCCTSFFVFAFSFFDLPFLGTCECGLTFSFWAAFSLVLTVCLSSVSFCLLSSCRSTLDCIPRLSPFWLSVRESKSERAPGSKI